MVHGPDIRLGIGHLSMRKATLFDTARVKPEDDGEGGS